MSEFSPGPPERQEYPEALDRVFGSDGDIMRVYHDYAWPVAELPFCETTEPAEQITVDYFDIAGNSEPESVQSYLLASVNPGDTLPASLVRRPHLRVVQMRTNVAFEATINTVTGHPEQVKFLDINQDSLSLRHELRVDSNGQVAGTRLDTHNQATVINEKDLQIAIGTVETSMRELKYLLDCGYFKYHRPHSDN